MKDDLIKRTSMTLQEAQHRLTKQLLIGGLIITSPKILFNVVLADLDELNYRIGLQLIIYAIIGLTLAFNKKINVKIQIAVIILIFMFLGFDSLFTYGIISSGILFIIAGIISALLLKKISSWLIFVISVGGIWTFGWLGTNGYLQSNFDYSNLTDNFSIWITRGFDIGLYMAIIFLSIMFVRRHLEDSLNDLQEKNRKLEEVSNELALSEEEIRMNYEELENFAYKDILTGLLNRSGFEKLVTEQIQKNPKDKFLLCYIDIMGFKRYNDLYGWETGDLFLIELANKFNRICNEGDFFARTSADNFVVFVQESTYTRPDDPGLNGFMNIFEEPLIINEIKLHISVCMGYAAYPRDGATAKELLMNAEIAMHHAKMNKEKVMFRFHESMIAEIADKHKMENALREYVKSKDIQLVYQPQVNAKTGEIIGFEALARWKSDEYGYVSPAEFIPILEESGLIIPFGMNIFESAIQTIIEINQKFNRNLKMSINVSAIEFEQPDYIEKIEKTLQKYDLHNSVLELEITEGTMIHEVLQVNEKLQKLQNLGFLTALDDFGTGYSSLSCILQLSLNTLKIDKAFIDAVEKDDKKRRLLDTIITMARELNLEVVAEGVETKEQLQIVQNIGCQVIQGYYYYKPMEKSQILALFENNEVNE